MAEQLAFVFGRTSPEFSESPTTLSGVSSPDWWEETLLCHPGQKDGRVRVSLPGLNGTRRGGSSTLNISESPSDAVASTLSQVLESGGVSRRFYLSVRACQGILRRAREKGKALPERLERVLLAAVAAPPLVDENPVVPTMCAGELERTLSNEMVEKGFRMIDNRVYRRGWSGSGEMRESGVSPTLEAGFGERRDRTPMVVDARVYERDRSRGGVTENVEISPALRSSAGKHGASSAPVMIERPAYYYNRQTDILEAHGIAPTVSATVAKGPRNGGCTFTVEDGHER